MATTFTATTAASDSLGKGHRGTHGQRPEIKDLHDNKAAILDELKGAVGSLEGAEDDYASGGRFRGVFDFAVHGGVAGAIAFGPTLPDNAMVTWAGYEVITTFQSPTGPDNATVGLGVTSDDATGIVAGVAINDGTNPWDSGAPKDGLPDHTAANFTTKTTAARQLNLTVGVEDITAGKLVCFGQYVVTE